MSRRKLRSSWPIPHSLWCTTRSRWALDLVTGSVILPVPGGGRLHDLARVCCAMGDASPKANANLSAISEQLRRLGAAGDAAKD